MLQAFVHCACEVGNGNAICHLFTIRWPMLTNNYMNHLNRILVQYTFVLMSEFDEPNNYDEQFMHQKDSIGKLTHASYQGASYAAVGDDFSKLYRPKV